jgi:hypothetical protein
MNQRTSNVRGMITMTGKRFIVHLTQISREVFGREG